MQRPCTWPFRPESLVWNSADTSDWWAVGRDGAAVPGTAIWNLSSTPAPDPRELRLLLAEKNPTQQALPTACLGEYTLERELAPLLFWWKNKALLCFWTKLRLVLLAQVTAGRRSLVGDRLGRVLNRSVKKYGAKVKTFPGHIGGGLLTRITNKWEWRLFSPKSWCRRLIIIKICTRLSHFVRCL